MFTRLIFTLSFLVATHPVSFAAQIELEHSIGFEGGSSWGTEGGSSWGTEGPWKAALSNSTLSNSAPFSVTQFNQKIEWVSLADEPLAKSRFTDSEMRIFNDKIQICVDRALYIPESFKADFYLFLDKLGVKEPVNWIDFNSNYLECSLFIQRGTWETFPYQSLSFLKGSLKAETLLGVFYQKSKKHLPVISLHPDAQFIFDSPNASVPYLNVIGNRLVVDAKTLLLHELAHAFGFSHLRSDDNAIQAPELTIMGKENRTAVETQLRFGIAKNLFNTWDDFQISVYRGAYQQAKNPACTFKNLKPVQDFMALFKEGQTLELAFERANTQSSLNPLNHQKLFIDNLMRSLRLGIEQDAYLFDSQVCPYVQSVFAGWVPSNARLSLADRSPDGRGVGWIETRLSFHYPSKPSSRFQSGYVFVSRSKVNRIFPFILKNEEKSLRGYTFCQTSKEFRLALPKYYSPESVANDEFKFLMSDETLRYAFETKKLTLVRIGDYILPTIELTARSNQMVTVRAAVTRNGKTLSLLKPIHLEVRKTLQECNKNY